MNKYKKNLRQKGFVFLKFDKNIKEFVVNVNKIVEPYLKKIYSTKIKNENYSKIIFQIQQKINKKFSTKYFFIKNKILFRTIFKDNKFAIQHYFYFRAVKPLREDDAGPVNFHRESFQGPDFYKHCFNLWIPLKNHSKQNALQYYPFSHKLKRHVDFDFVEKWTQIKKNSYSHKIGSLYKEKILKFRKQAYPKRLYKKKHAILFSGELMHGNATNLTNKIRMSLDMRFMLKKYMKKNPVQGATGRKYFKTISL